MNETNTANQVAKKKKEVAVILIPNLPPQSVIVLHNFLYHCVQVDKPLLSYAVEADTISRFCKTSVVGDRTRSKADTYQLILVLKTKEKPYQ